MNSIKLLSENLIVDAIKNPCYVVYVPRLGLFLACPEAEAQGIASRTGMTYYHLDGREDFGVDGYQTVSAVSISDEEADDLITALEAGEKPVEPEPDPGGGEEAEPPVVLSLPVVYERLVAAEGEISNITQAIERGLSL